MTTDAKTRSPTGTKSLASTVTLHACPTCNTADSIIRVHLPAVVQTALLPKCDCWAPELEIGDDKSHAPSPEFIAAVDACHAENPTDVEASILKVGDTWWDVSRSTPAPDLERRIHKAAIEYVARGYAIVPLHGVSRGRCTCRRGAKCKSPGKHPIRGRWQVRTLRSQTQLASYFRSRGGRPTNIGVLVSVEQRLLLVDVDRKKGKRGDETIKEWERKLGIDLCSQMVQQTPSGGWHCLFRVPKGYGRPLPNGANVAPGVDVLTDRKQFVVAPSVTEKGAYAHSEHDGILLPTLHELPEAPEALLDHLSGLPQATPTRGHVVGTPEPEDLLGPSVEAVRRLVRDTPNGEDIQYGDYVSMAHYIKGACGPERESEGREIFNEWAGRWESGGNDSEVNEEKFDSIGWKQLRSGWPQLIRAAARFGATTEAIRQAKTVEAQREFAFATRESAGARGTAPKGDWQRPIPILDDEDIKPFPVDTLPSVFRRYVESVAKSQEVPVDVPGINLLGSVAGAAQWSLDGIRVHEDYREPIGLFLACQLHSGEGKTAVVSEFRRPFERAQMRLRERARPQRAQAEARRNLVQGEKKVLERQIDDANKRLSHLLDPQDAAKQQERESLLKRREDLSERLLQVSGQLEAIEIASDRLLWLTEGTPEAISKHLAEQQYLVVSGSEGDLIDVFAGQYQSRGTAKLGPLLSAYSGESFTEARMHGVREVRDPRLTVMLTIQPSVIEKMRSQPEFASRGLTPRFLFSAPRSLVGSRTWEMKARIDREARGRYEQLIGNLLGVDLSGADDFDDLATDEGTVTEDLGDDAEESQGRVGAVIDAIRRELRLSPRAYEEYLGYRRAVEPRLVDESDGLSGFAAWGNKLPGQMLRIAAALHLMEHADAGGRAWDIEVGPESVMQATRIAEYFLAHMVRLFVERPQVREKIVLDWLRREGLRQFNPRDLFRSQRRKFGKMSELNKTLDTLEDLGWLRPHCLKSASGRPPRSYLVNPYLWDERETDGAEPPGAAA